MEIKIGNIIKIMKNELVVIHTETIESIDNKWNKCYAHMFTTITKEDFDSAKVNPKEKIWTLKDTSTMHGPNEVLSTKVEVIDSVNIQTEVTKVYRSKP